MMQFIYTIKFLVSIPSFFSWIGLQTLRDLQSPTVEPELDQYNSLDVTWKSPFGTDWTRTLETIPALAEEKGVMKRLPIHIWNDAENGWLEGATLEEHQTTPLMYMNENSPMPGTLLYHFLGKGKSAASISISRMYPKRKILVLVPASLRSNYMKEISKFGGSMFRMENEWVFVPVAAKSGGTLKNIWNPNAEF